MDQMDLPQIEFVRIGTHTRAMLDFFARMRVTDDTQTSYNLDLDASVLERRCSLSRQTAITDGEFKPIPMVAHDTIW